MEEEYVLRYTESGGLTIAYQVWGSSKDTLVYVPGMISHLEAGLEDSEYLSWIRELSKSFRLIIFDKRGQGLSDRDSSAPNLEERMDDITGIAVNIAARALEKCHSNIVMITKNLEDLLGRTKFSVTSMGGYSQKGLEGDWE